MSRRRSQREGRQFITRPTCAFCGMIPGKDPQRHFALCESFRLFRDALQREFTEAVDLLPESHHLGLIKGFRACHQIQDLAQMLQQLLDSSHVASNHNAQDRFNTILGAALRFQLAAIHPTFEQFRSELRARYDELGGEMRGFKMQQFDTCRDVAGLRELLLDTVQHLKHTQHQDLPAAEMLLAELQRFAASHGDDPPPASSVSSVPPETGTRVA